MPPQVAQFAPDRAERRPHGLQDGRSGQEAAACHDVVAQVGLAGVERDGHRPRCGGRPGRVRAQPVAPAPEDGGGEGGAARPRARPECGPVDGDAAHPEPGEFGEVAPLHQPGDERGAVVAVEQFLRLAARADLSRPDLRVLLAAGERGQRGGQLGTVRGDHGEPRLHVPAAELAGGGELPQGGAAGVRVGDVGGDASRVDTQRVVVPGGQHEELPRAVGFAGRLGARGGGVVLLHDDMGVGAARAEGADAGAAGVAVRRRPRLGPPYGPERRPVEVDLRVGVLQVDARDQGAVPQLEQDLGEAGDARRGLQVADVGLHRPDDPAPGTGRAGVGAGRCGAEGADESCHLDRVAQFGAGAVRLQVADRGRVDAGTAQGLGDDGRLGVRVRHGVSAGLAAGVDRAALDHRPDVVAVGDGGGQWFEQHGADALSGDVAVGPLVEDLAGAVGRQHVQRGQGHVVRGVQYQVDPAGDGHPALAAAQALAGEVHRGQGRGAGGVDGEAGALEVEEVRHPVGHRPVRGVRAGQPPLRPLGGAEFPVRAVHQAHEDAGGGLVGVLAQVSGLLQQVPAGLQEEPLLRVDVVGVARQDAEEARVEAVDVLKETAPAAGGALRRPPSRVVVRPPVPAVGRDLGDAVLAAQQVAPVGVQVGCAGVAPADTDHRDVAPLGGPGRDGGRGGAGRGQGGCGGGVRAAGGGRGGCGRGLGGHGLGGFRQGRRERGRVLRAQALGQPFDGGLLEQQRGGERPQVLLEAPDDGEADQGVDTEVLEGDPVAEVVRVVLEHFREDQLDVAADRVGRR